MSHWARAWGYRPLVPAVALLTSELATNAVVHTHEPFRVVIANSGRGVRVTVQDCSCEAPVVREPDPADPHGRGLKLVDDVAGRWGVQPESRGKAVWFEVDVHDQTAHLG